MKLKNRITILFFFLFFCASGCSAEKQIVLSGKTMGTTWRVVIISGEKKVPADLKQDIKQTLKSINKSMSLFDDESELSHFNKSEAVKGKFCGSDEFISLFKVGKNLYNLSNGSWDGTIGPLVNLWGFGNTTREISLPPDSKIRERLKSTGFKHIRLINEHCLVKDLPGIVLDFGSIAKGYGVDVLAELLRKNGINNFLVEIGGEVYASGNKINKLWKVGIKTPELLPQSNRIYKVIELENMAIATSGDYRNFREINGKLYSHIISPLTGYPVTNKVASVSVTATSTAFADGLATAVMVMGTTDGLQLVNSLEDIECLVITREENGKFSAHTSSAWGK